MRTTRWAGALLLVTALLSACGDEAITGVPFEPLYGTWTAVAFNNAPLPIVEGFTQGSLSCVARTHSLQISFDAQGRYSYIDETETQCGENPPGNASNPHSGTYRVVGDVLYLRATGQLEQSTEMTLEGNVLVIQLYNLEGTPLPLELHRTSGG